MSEATKQTPARTTPSKTQSPTPAPMPKPKTPSMARPVRVRVGLVVMVNGHAQLKITSGTADGVKKGMKGRFIGEKGDSFRIGEANQTESTAFVSDPVDQANRRLKESSPAWHVEIVGY